MPLALRHMVFIVGVCQAPNTFRLKKASQDCSSYNWGCCWLNGSQGPLPELQGTLETLIQKHLLDNHWAFVLSPSADTYFTNFAGAAWRSSVKQSEPICCCSRGGEAMHAAHQLVVCPLHSVISMLWSALDWIRSLKLLLLCSWSMFERLPVTLRNTIGSVLFASHILLLIMLLDID